MNAIRESPGSHMLGAWVSKKMPNPTALEKSGFGQSCIIYFWRERNARRNVLPPPVLAPRTACDDTVSQYPK
eukprot:2783236-Amphidinium_carterae.1